LEKIKSEAFNKNNRRNQSDLTKRNVSGEYDGGGDREGGGGTGMHSNVRGTPVDDNYSERAANRVLVQGLRKTWPQRKRN